MLVFHLFNRENLAAKTSELGKFLLNCLQPFLPLAVSNLGLGSIPISKAILIIQFLNLSDLRTETPYLFTKNIQVIHVV